LFIPTDSLPLLFIPDDDIPLLLLYQVEISFSYEVGMYRCIPDHVRLSPHAYPCWSPICSFLLLWWPTCC
jgi:hypothetical protein